ncbi:hypothetical protein [Thalassotalea euphylliae]|nr:hypothetical protein [Thalassotalea euphylliae]
MGLLDSEQSIDLQLNEIAPVEVRITIGQRVLMLGILTLATVAAVKVLR